eukprot:scaffold71359_cov43-Cyclotella_meneghiniana.AAC.1
MARSNKPSKKTNKKKRRRSSSSSSDDSASSEDAAAVRGNPPFNIHPNQLSRAVRHAFNYAYPNIEALKIAAGYQEGSLIAGNIRQPGQGKRIKADPRKRSRAPSTGEDESPTKRQKRSSGRVNYQEDDVEMDEGDVQSEEELSSSKEEDFGDSSDSDSEEGGV